MRLAMASKEMHERCMKDKRIRINLQENQVTVRTINRATTFSFESFDVAEDHVDKYLEKMRTLNCNVSLQKIRFVGFRVSLFF